MKNSRSKRILSFVLCMVMVLGVIGFGGDRVSASSGTVTYQSHIQDIGWQSYVSNGTVSGTSGQSRRLEAIRIKLENVSGSIEYRTHVQDIGWMGWVSDNAVSGTSGQSKRLEAIEIHLTGPAAERYDIYYCVHVQNFGWMDWAKNGESSGSTGYSYRMEAIEIKLVPKGGTSPGSMNRPFSNKFDSPVRVCYQSHVQDIGWQSYVSNGTVSGTSGQSRRLEAIRIKLENVSGSIEYRTHVQDIGWMGWVANDALSGTSGLSKRLEAIEIRLTGEAAEKYDVYYRVHVQNTGWMDWAKNGESAGTAGYSYRTEAIQVVLVSKGGASPGSTTRPFAQADNLECSIYQLPNHESVQSMGYVIRTSAGKVLVIDGGSEDVTPDLTSLILALGGTVDAWFVTHPHSDHVTAMMNIMNHCPKIQIKKIYGNLVDYNTAVELGDYAAADVQNFNNFIIKHQDIFQSVNTGDMFTFDGVRIEVLMASNPELMNNFINNQSVVYKLYTKEKSAIFLGDLGVESSEKLIQTAGNKLDSDIVQVAHHGSYGVSQAVYHAISPRICLWPCPEWLWNNEGPQKTYNGGPWGTIEVRVWMDNMGANNVVAKDGYAKIEIAGAKLLVSQSAALQTLLTA